MAYFGGKGASGVYQQIINRIPPHKTFVSAFLGNCAVMRYKRPAQNNIAIDLDQQVIDNWTKRQAEQAKQQTHPKSSKCYLKKSSKKATQNLVPKLRMYNQDATSWLYTHDLQRPAFVFCDPPYLHETRKSSHRYRHEFSIKEHKQLLACLQELDQKGYKIMLCGYWSKLYADTLKNWNTHKYQATTRSGKVAEEWLWFNYEKPKILHDYRYLGHNFRERERIKRKVQRWRANLAKMPELEKRAIISATKALSHISLLAYKHVVPMGTYFVDSKFDDEQM